MQETSDRHHDVNDVLVYSYIHTKMLPEGLHNGQIMVKLKCIMYNLQEGKNCLIRQI